MTAVESERPVSLYELQRQIEREWAVWLCTLFPDTISSPFASHHIDFWEHVWTVNADRAPVDPFVAVWNRGGAKSSSLEAAVVALGARRVRRYCLYVCRTQDQADDHIAAIGTLLESPELAAFYPDLATRKVGKYGAARAWRRNRLWTAGGFVVDAMGLDSSARGARLDTQRPDIIVLDDIDSEEDTAENVRKLERILTKRILPTATSNAVILAGQNLIHDESVFARLADGRADYLQRRRLSGPVPAIVDLDVEMLDGRWTIVGGDATWLGFDVAACQAFIDTWGLSAFLSEAQHETEPVGGGIFDHLDFEAIRTEPFPLELLHRTVLWCDPAVTKSDHSDAHGVCVAGIAGDGVIYMLFSWEQRATPVETLKLAIRKAVEFGCAYVGVETDQGGETWESVVWRAKAAVIFEMAEEMGLVAVGGASEDALPEVLAPYEGWVEPWAITAVRMLEFRSRKAGEGYGPKQGRAQRMLVDYEVPGGRIRHVVGTHRILERALRRFGRVKPFDLVDAEFWAWLDLRTEGATGTAADVMANLGPWRRR